MELTGEALYKAWKASGLEQWFKTYSAALDADASEPATGGG